MFNYIIIILDIKIENFFLKKNSRNKIEKIFTNADLREYQKKLRPLQKSKRRPPKNGAFDSRALFSMFFLESA